MNKKAYEMIELIDNTFPMYVLEIEARNEIKELLEKEFAKKFSGNELDEYVDRGLDSDLWELEEIIDIYNLKTIQVIKVI